MQINSQPLEDGDLPVDRQVVDKLAYDQHRQHRSPWYALFDWPGRKLSNNHPVAFLTDVLAANVALHIKLRSLYFQNLGNLILQTCTTAYIFGRLNDDLFSTQRRRKGMATGMLLCFKFGFCPLM